MCLVYRTNAPLAQHFILRKSHHNAFLCFFHIGIVIFVFAVDRDENSREEFFLKYLIDIEICCRLCPAFDIFQFECPLRQNVSDFLHVIVNRQSHILFFAAYLDYNFQFIFRLMIITFYYNLYVKSAGGNQMKTYLKFAVVISSFLVYRRY